MCLNTFMKYVYLGLNTSMVQVFVFVSDIFILFVFKYFLKYLTLSLLTTNTHTCYAKC